MSWPQDGEPRYKLIQISGGIIHTGYGNPFTNHRGTNGTEFYILDRANCHRVVERFVNNTKLSSTLSRVTKELKRLNDEASG